MMLAKGARCARVLLISALAGNTFAIAAATDTFPTKSIRFNVPWPPGGGADYLSRVVAQKLTERYGQNVVVDNRGGAGGVIGTELAAKAPADGYTWMLETAPTTIVPALHPKLGFDVLRDFTPVSLIASAPYVLASHPSLPVKSVAELVAHAKLHPGQLSYSSSGNGSVPHLAGAIIRAARGRANHPCALPWYRAGDSRYAVGTRAVDDLQYRADADANQSRQIARACCHQRRAREAVAGTTDGRRVRLRRL